MRILLFLILSVPSFAAFSHSVKITIDHTKVGGSNISNYVDWVCANGSVAPCDAGAHSNLSIPNLKVVGSGGAVTSSSGYDVGFGSNPTCASAYQFELEAGSYVGSTGFGSWFVQVGTVSSSVDTDYYMCFGNASITTDQSSTTTWTTDSNFTRVYHVPMVLNNASKGGIESTGQGPTIGWQGSNAQQVATYMNGASDVINANNKGQTTGETGLPLSSVPASLSMWINTTQTARSIGPFGFAQNSNNNNSLVIVVDSTGHAYLSSATGATAHSTAAVNDGNWHQVVASTNGTNSGKIYIDGALDVTSVGAYTTTLSDCVGIGAVCNDADVFACQTGGTCKLDEMRVRSDQIAAGRITADYNNQVSPWTFQTFGADTPIGGGAGIRHRVIQ